MGTGTTGPEAFAGRGHGPGKRRGRRWDRPPAQGWSRQEATARTGRGSIHRRAAHRVPSATTGSRSASDAASVMRRLHAQKHGSTPSAPKVRGHGSRPQSPANAVEDDNRDRVPSSRTWGRRHQTRGAGNFPVAPPRRQRRPRRSKCAPIILPTRSRVGRSASGIEFGVLVRPVDADAQVYGEILEVQRLAVTQGARRGWERRRRRETWSASKPMNGQSVAISRPHFRPHRRPWRRRFCQGNASGARSSSGLPDREARTSGRRRTSAGKARLPECPRWTG